MNIEIIEFYPIERNEVKDRITGTLRIKIPDIGIHILGIYVLKCKDRWFITMPGKQGTHHETGEKLRYPYVVFEDREKQRELMTAIREQGRAFVEKRLADTENPLIFPQKAKETAAVANLKPNPTPAKPSAMIPRFVDPPKRKEPFYRTNKNR